MKLDLDGVELITKEEAEVLYPGSTELLNQKDNSQWWLPAQDAFPVDDPAVGRSGGNLTRRSLLCVDQDDRLWYVTVSVKSREVHYVLSWTGERWVAPPVNAHPVRHSTIEAMINSGLIEVDDKASFFREVGGSDEVYRVI